MLLIKNYPSIHKKKEVFFTIDEKGTIIKGTFPQWLAPAWQHIWTEGATRFFNEELLIVPPSSPGFLDAVKEELFHLGLLLEIEGEKEYTGQGGMIAWYPSPEIAAQLALPDGESSEELHCTLVFFPDMAEVPEERIAGILGGLSGELLEGSISGLGRFSASESSEGKDVLYASVDVPGLAELRAQLTETLQEAEIPIGEDHGFTPHITLKYLEPDEEIPLEHFEPISVAIDKLCLCDANGKLIEEELGGGQKQTDTGPVNLDLGCGDNKPEGYIGIDKMPGPQVDVQHDLEQNIPWPDSSVDEVRANHFLEHVPEPIRIMNEIWRVLKPDGLLRFEVPSTEGIGAFADPTHKSFWNLYTFNWFINDELRNSSGIQAKFEPVELEQYGNPEYNAVYVRGILKAVKPELEGLPVGGQKEAGEKAALHPIQHFIPPKPAMKLRAHTDAFSPEEIWSWVEKHLKNAQVTAEQKLNGFRAILQKSGSRLSIFFEDSQEERAAKLMAADSQLDKLKNLPDCIFDCNVGVQEDGKPWPRPRLMTLTADNPELPSGAHILITAFDILYWDGESVNEKPFAERRKLLEGAKGKLSAAGVEITGQAEIKSKADLAAAWRSSKFGNAPLSEGLVLKASDWIYESGASTDGMCLPAGTPIWVNGRVLPIENVAEGQCLGEREVVATVSYSVNELIGFIPYALPPVWATPKHQFEILRYPQKAEYRSEGWKHNISLGRRGKSPQPELLLLRANEIRAGDNFVLKQPIYSGSLLEAEALQDPEFYELLGWYVAEGDADNQACIRLGQYGRETTDRLATIAKRYFSKVYVWHEEDWHGFGWSNGQGGAPGRCSVYFPGTKNPGVAAWFRHQFGDRSWNKHMPAWMWAASNECLEAFLKGYWAGDGSIEEKWGFCQAGTVSRELAWQLWFLLLRLGRVFLIRLYPPQFENQRPQWALAGYWLPWMTPNKKENHHWRRENGFVALPIRNIIQGKGQEQVYHLQTTDEMFLCPVSSHNSKIKHSLEVKALVLEVKSVAGGKYNFRGGLIPGTMEGDLDNLVDFKGKKYVDLGFSFNGTFAAKEGDIITAEIEEINWDRPDRRLNWLGANPLDVDKERTEPYAARQVIEMAQRTMVLQETPEDTAANGKKLLARLDDMPNLQAILAVSEVASEGLAGQTGKIGDLRKGAYETPGNIPIIVTYHPSALLRTGQQNSKYYREFHNDVSKAVELAQAGKAEKIIVKENGKWVLYSRDRSRVLGRFDTQKEAIERELQIQFFRHQGEKAGEEGGGETHGGAAEAFWKNDWQTMFPPSGMGDFVYMRHWRGLSEEESKLDEKELLQTDHSVHGDLRLENGKALWGFSIFLGKTSDVRGGRDLNTLPPDDALEGSFKLAQPKEWLTIARRSPYISEPGGVGATSLKYSKFFEEDHGIYSCGVWNRHSVEIFLDGNELKGRYIIQSAPVGKERIWLIRKPADQKPYAETHNLDKVAEELKSRGHEYLLWAAPGLKPKLVEL